MTESLLILIGMLGLLASAWPLWQAWQTMRRTSLRDALMWLMAAWFCWLAAGMAYWLGQPLTPWRYLAVSVTGCFFAAVLGARRPGMAAWNFVTLGLLAALLLPCLEQPWRAPHWHLDEPRTIFLSGVLAVGLLNYLPTRFFWATWPTAAVVFFEMRELVESATRTNPALHLGLSLLGIAIAAFAAWLRVRRRLAVGLDRLWFTFRDGFGAAWGLRAMEQFNAAARHAQWPVSLTWHGLESQGTETAVVLPQEVEQKLRAVLKRFVGDDSNV
jgi:hypothetical protein